MTAQHPPNCPLCPKRRDPESEAWLRQQEDERRSRVRRARRQQVRTLLRGHR